MFRSLLTDRTNAFDRAALALLALGLATFALTIVFGFGELTSTDQVVTGLHGVVTSHIVSYEPLLNDLGGSLMNLPSIRL